MSPIAKYQKILQKFADHLYLLPEFMTRASLGFIFFQSGLGKIKNMDRTVQFFQSIGILGATFQAPLVAGIEFLSGLFLIVGLFTRLASISLAVIMCVAIRAAKWSEVTDLPSFFSLTEYLYLVLLLWLVARGGGFLSLDRFFWGRSVRSYSEG